jgi:hypothetical protein
VRRIPREGVERKIEGLLGYLFDDGYVL